MSLPTFFWLFAKGSQDSFLPAAFVGRRPQMWDLFTMILPLICILHLRWMQAFHGFPQFSIVHIIAYPPASFTATIYGDQSRCRNLRWADGPDEVRDSFAEKDMNHMNKVWTMYEKNWTDMKSSHLCRLHASSTALKHPTDPYCNFRVIFVIMRSEQNQFSSFSSYLIWSSDLCFWNTLDAKLYCDAVLLLYTDFCMFCMDINDL